MLLNSRLWLVSGFLRSRLQTRILAASSNGLLLSLHAVDWLLYRVFGEKVSHVYDAFIIISFLLGWQLSLLEQSFRISRLFVFLDGL